MNRKNLHLSAGGAHADGEHHEHIAPLSMYMGVFGALVVLTIVTVGVSELGIPQPYSLILAMIVAVCKASLVVTFFMHRLWDDRLNSLVFVGTVIFVGFFFALTMTDLLSRDLLIKETGNHVKQFEQHDRWEACMKTGTYDECRPQLPKGWVETNPDAVEGHHGGDHAEGGDHADKAGSHDKAEGHDKAAGGH
jgi:cytochrome c oxidase subunit 4